MNLDRWMEITRRRAATEHLVNGARYSKTIWHMERKGAFRPRAKDVTQRKAESGD